MLSQGLKSSIVRLRATDMEKLELRERAKMNHSRGRDVAGIQVQALEIDESGKRFEPVVRY